MSDYAAFSKPERDVEFPNQRITRRPNSSPDRRSAGPPRHRRRPNPRPSLGCGDAKRDRGRSNPRRPRGSAKRSEPHRKARMWSRMSRLRTGEVERIARSWSRRSLLGSRSWPWGFRGKVPRSKGSLLECPTRIRRKRAARGERELDRAVIEHAHADRGKTGCTGWTIFPWVKLRLHAHGSEGQRSSTVVTIQAFH